MEASYISSSTSFTKAMRVVPMIGEKVPIFANKYQTTKRIIANPFSVSCCQRSTSSTSLGSNQGEAGPILANSDWRAFRARLVAQEQRGGGTPPTANSVQEKWAHRIHELEKGCLLIATEELDGIQVFERAVVLILSTGPIGPTGLILNRPAEVSISEVGTSLFGGRSGPFDDRPLFPGGPLEDGLLLMGGPNGGDAAECGGFEEVMEGLYYGTEESVGFAADMVRRNVVGVGDLSFFDGCCRWERGQLMGEVRDGKWAVAACSPSLVGLSCVGRVGLWEEVNGLLSPRKVM